EYAARRAVARRGHNPSCWIAWRSRCVRFAGLFGLQRLACGLCLSFGGGCSFDLAIAADVFLMLGIGLGEDMTFAWGRALGDEVEVFVVVRIGDSAQRLDARIGNRRRRQTVDLIGVVGGLGFDFRTADAAVERRLT